MKVVYARGGAYVRRCAETHGGATKNSIGRGGGIYLKSNKWAHRKRGSIGGSKTNRCASLARGVAVVGTIVPDREVILIAGAGTREQCSRSWTRVRELRN